LLMPHLDWPGRVAISWLASGSSEINIGYMSMAFVSWRLLCHWRLRGCW
jgi:hypothetical protein